jgi:oxygen-independent coproporphyrinogen-3 oxidase
VGVDLIFALPPSLGRDLADDLDRILALDPEHISVYGLTVEKGTPLARWVAEGKIALPDEDRYGEEYLLVAERLTAAGYLHYEVSNFARPGRESRHNSAYWREAPYLGLGNGAHSYVPPRRWWNRRDWSEYRSAVAAGASPRESFEVVDAETGRLERVWLDLRTSEGVERSRLAESQLRMLDAWAARGWAAPADAPGRTRLTAEGWLLLDRLTVELEGAAGAVA